MNKVDILCDKDRILMEDFSRLSLIRMSSHTTLLGSLPFFSTYQDTNVKKEVDKDRLIIREAARAFEAGRPVCDLDLEDIFEKTKEVDKVFLNKLLIAPFTLSVRYSDFADIRIQRIWLISRTVYALLAHWPEGGSFIDAVRNAYPEKKFKDVLAEILHLYNEETRMLSKSIRHLGPFRSVVGTYTDALYRSMEDVKEDITRSAVQRIFGDKTVYA
ncbi:MAG TPA: hypothetical protein VL122_12615 [Nitrospirota bacterium]|nr:hypothetical protein [Nitrospirota bacterium]